MDFIRKFYVLYCTVRTHKFFSAYLKKIQSPKRLIGIVTKSFQIFNFCKILSQPIQLENVLHYFLQMF